jgi:hypothetical protein
VWSTEWAGIGCALAELAEKRECEGRDETIVSEGDAERGKPSVTFSSLFQRGLRKSKAVGKGIECTPSPLTYWT